MSDLALGILLGVVGLVVVGGLVLAGFFYGARRKKSPKEDPPPPTASQKRRFPSSGSVIPAGGIAQTRFRVSSYEKDAAKED